MGSEGCTDQLIFSAVDLLFLNGESTAQLPLQADSVARHWQRSSLQSASLQAGPRGRHLKTHRSTYASAGRPRYLGEVEVPQSRGVRGLAGRPRGQPVTHRRAAAGLPHRRRPTALCPAAPARQSSLAGVLAPLQVPKMALAERPPRDSRFSSPLKPSRVHCVRPERVVEVTYLTWTKDNLLRQVYYQGQREPSLRESGEGHPASA